MEYIDTAGVQRMCRNALALQQTLSSITASREVALDYARSFYEMFYLEPDVRFSRPVQATAHCSFFAPSSTGNFNLYHRKRVPVHRDAVLECPPPGLQEPWNRRSEHVGHVSAEAERCSGYQTWSRGYCLAIGFRRNKSSI